ncbi:MAG TPA: CHAP domain-containing protein [Solirubrobacterales bacterium]|nr:CHAP domain-containing protein [Solirubrobacterales bacterium]
MSLETTLARIAAIESALYPAPPTTGGVSASAATTGTAPAERAGGSSSAYSSLSSPASPTFSQLLGQATLGGTSPLLGLGQTSTAASPGLAAVEAARTQIGQAEMPPGSNDSPRIAEYRGAVQGAVVGPWCADFASWCAAQAGAPLGENGEGFQSVSALWSWAEASGRAVPAASGTPEAGDLIVWGGEHVGLIESVDPDGTIHTIEGNSSDEVAQRTYPPGDSGATGYVRLG